MEKIKISENAFMQRAKRFYAKEGLKLLRNRQADGSYFLVDVNTNIVKNEQVFEAIEDELRENGILKDYEVIDV